MLCACIWQIRQHPIESVRQEEGNKYHEGRGHYGAEDDSPICLLRTLQDERFQLYNLLVLENYSQLTVNILRFQPNPIRESDAEESTYNKTESDDTNSNFDIADVSTMSNEFEEIED
jgi:hypothetical protein